MKKSEFVGFTSETVRTKKTKKHSLIINLFFSLLILAAAGVGIFKLIDVLTPSPSEEQSTFPKLEISLESVTIEQIDLQSKETEYLGNTVTITTDSNSISFEDVEIKGRGNTTWEQPKKPYQIKFADRESLFDHDKGKKWVLLANYLDPTSLRTSTGFYLEKILEENHPVSGDFVELYIDNNYRGLYYLTEKVEIDKSRINLNDPLGILVEVDNVWGGLDGCYRDNNNGCIVIKGIVNEDKKDDVIQSFIINLDLVLDAIDDKNYNKIAHYFDIDSFAKYYLLSEFTANPDAYNTSFYMYRDGENDKIHAGPGWDFDFALGNKNWSPKWVDQQFYSPSETMFLKRYINRPSKGTMTSVSTIFYDLMDLPEFEAKVKEIYQKTLSGKKEELLDHIKSEAEYIRSAALKDGERWKLQTNFDEEVNYLLDWVSKRYDHFEETYGANSTVAEPEN